MALTFKLSSIIPQMLSARVVRVHAEQGEHLRSGAKLLDLAVDLSAEFPQDCPPISYFRVILREPAVLRQVSVKTGEDCEIGTQLCLLTSGPDEPIDGPPTRDVRAVAVGIIYESEFDEAMI